MHLQVESEPDFADFMPFSPAAVAHPGLEIERGAVRCRQPAVVEPVTRAVRIPVRLEYVEVGKEIVLIDYVDPDRLLRGKGLARSPTKGMGRIMTGETPMAAATEKKDPEPLTRWAKENVEAIVVAFIMALVIRCFCIEVFKIPTSSMEPYLLGELNDNHINNCRDVGFLHYHDKRRGGDRIMVTKYFYSLAPIRRFDVDLVAGNEVDALSTIVHVGVAERKGREMIRLLSESIPRHMFQIALQASIGKRIVAREDIKALSKNVTAKCYGGDVSRKRKLLEKQKAGKRRMKSVGR